MPVSVLGSVAIAGSKVEAIPTPRVLRVLRGRQTLPKSHQNEYVITSCNKSYEGKEWMFLN